MVSRLPASLLIPRVLGTSQQQAKQPEAFAHRGLATPQQLLQPICGWAATRRMESLDALGVQA